MNDIRIWIAICVGVVSILTTAAVCVKQIGKLISKVNSASEKIDKLALSLWTPDGKHRFVDRSDCQIHRANLEKAIEKAIETAMLKMARQIDKDFKGTIARIHERFDEMRDKQT
jgi:hypothetical protein